MPDITEIPNPTQPHELAFNEAVEADRANAPYRVVHFLMLAQAQGSIPADHILRGKASQHTLRVNRRPLRVQMGDAQRQATEALNVVNSGYTPHLFACCILYGIGYEQNLAVARVVFKRLMVETADAKYWYLLGQCYAKDNDHNTAQAYYQHAIRKGSVPARVELGIYHRKYGDLQRARAHFESCLGHSKSAEVRYQLACMYVFDDPVWQYQTFMKAESLLLEFAERGDARTTSLLGSWYYYASRTEEDGPLSLHWKKRSALLYSEDNQTAFDEQVRWIQDIKQHETTWGRENGVLFAACQYELTYIELYQSAAKNQPISTASLSAFMNAATLARHSLQLDIDAVQSLTSPFTTMMNEVLSSVVKNRAVGEHQDLKNIIVSWFKKYYTLLQNNPVETVALPPQVKALEGFAILLLDPLFKKEFNAEPDNSAGKIYRRILATMAISLCLQESPSPTFIQTFIQLAKAWLTEVATPPHGREMLLIARALVKIASFDQYRISRRKNHLELGLTELKLLIHFAERAVQLVLPTLQDAVHEEVDRTEVIADDIDPSDAAAPNQALEVRTMSTGFKLYPPDMIVGGTGYHVELDAADDNIQPLVAADDMARTSASREMTEARERHLVAVKGLLDNLIPAAKPVSARRKHARVG